VPVIARMTVVSGMAIVAGVSVEAQFVDIVCAHHKV
jgi:hypothetical protein